MARRTLALLTALAVLTVSGAVLAAYLHASAPRGDRRALEPGESPRAVFKPLPRDPEPPPPMVRVTFVVLPAEAATRATVFVYDRPIEGGAQKLQVGYPTKVVVKAEGWATLEQTVTVEGETTVTLTMKKK